MTALSRLARVQRALVTMIVVRAVVLGLLAFLLAYTVVQLVAHTAAMPIALLAGVSAAAIVALTIRSVRSLPRVALWIEEQTPSLRYALVTVADGHSVQGLEQQATAVPWWDDATRRAWRSLLMPLAGLVLAASIFLGLSSRGAAFDFAFSRGKGSGTAASSHVDPLAHIRITVEAPAYSRRKATQSEDPTSIEALIGSRVTVDGNGRADELTANIDSTARVLEAVADGWRNTFAMPTRPALIRLHSALGKDRLIVLAPIADAPPAVTLLQPARDTILRKPTGVIPLHAQLRDDIGLRDADFEFVISSGGGENFTFRTGRVGHVALDGRVESTLDGRISIDSLALKPGDILQLRAVARDANNVTGPGVGSSETRSIRIARPDEYDSVSVEQMPPPEAEGQTLSQRMLINLTEALVKKLSQLTHPMLVSESRKIGSEQRKLRKKVGDIVFQRLGGEPLSEEGADEPERGKLTPEQLLAMADSVTSSAGGVMDVEGDETPILAINKPLLEAFNAMWDAGRSLDVGEPAKALPPMRIALAAIEKARTAERIYLRGRPGTTIVDVSKIRLSGKDKGSASLREARMAVSPLAKERSETFERVTSLLTTNPEAAADSLLLMRVEALADAPVLAAALDDAAKALRKRDTTELPLAWQRVRRALGGPDAQRSGITPWLGAP